MTQVPTIAVFDPKEAGKTTDRSIPLPAVFTAPIRNDIVHFVHSNLAKNRRQAHGVDPRAGHKHSAESWGTGRAVARIPRVSGSGTHRSGQAAFGNQCRKGRMFAPLKTWRRWHRRVNIKQKRHAVASALAASAIAPLVLARGHRINNVNSLPYVFDDSIENYEKTKEAVAFLKRIGAYDDVKKVIDTQAIRSGKGKLRGRRYKTRKGPLVIYNNDNVKLLKAVRNIPGVEVCNVNRLNILQLAPGGQIGRFCIWTESAFNALNTIFGSYTQKGEGKSDYQLNRSIMTNADITRIINSNEVQSKINDAKRDVVLHDIQKRNPLTNDKILFKLNPNAKLTKETARRNNEAQRKKRQEAIEKKRAISRFANKKEKKERKSESRKWFNNFNKELNDANQRGIDEEAAWKAEGVIEDDE